MKLLLDENLSDRIIPRIIDLYPGSAHVKSHDLVRTDDILIWFFARKHGYAIVSKDADFHQRSLVIGHPPRLIFLRVGNCPTSHITLLLRSNYPLLLSGSEQISRCGGGGWWVVGASSATYPAANTVRGCNAWWTVGRGHVFCHPGGVGGD